MESVRAMAGVPPPPRVLTEENARAVLDECMAELGTLFGSNPESLKVGITGSVEFVELDRMAFGISAVVTYMVLLILESVAVARGRERDLDWTS